MEEEKATLTAKRDPKLLKPPWIGELETAIALEKKRGEACDDEREEKYSGSGSGGGFCLGVKIEERIVRTEGVRVLTWTSMLRIIFGF